MPNTITAFPQPRISQWFSRPGPFARELTGYTSLHDSGRAAIYWAFRGLRLRDDTVVKMPSYHCGAEVQAVLDAGLKVAFYRVRPDMSIDLEDLERKLSRERGPVFVIHYYGFGQPEISRITEMCHRAEVPCIEDCAHSLFSKDRDRPLGNLGTLAVFSLRKTLPLFEGGAFRVNPRSAGDRKFPVVVPELSRSSMSAYRAFLREGVRNVVGDTGMDRYYQWRGASSCEPRVWTSALQESHRYADRLAPISLRAAASTDPDQLVQRRRRNWGTFDAGLTGTPGYRKVFDQLADGVCPLFLPIRASDRDALAAALRHEKIETFVFGKFPHEIFAQNDFPETSRLRAEVLCLPVHQELRENQIERMITVLRPLLAKYGLPERP